MHRIFHTFSKSCLLLTVLTLAALISGCAPAKSTQQRKAIFFPPAPDPPRIEFLTGFAKSSDIEEKKSALSLLSLGSDQQGPEVIRTLTKPYGIAAYQSRIYVADTITGHLSVIDLEQKTFRHLPGNEGPGRLQKPVNLAVDDEGNLYVADTKRLEVLIYDAAGDYVASVGRMLDIKPVDVAVDKDFLYILDLSHSDIKVLDRKTFKHLDTIGRNSENPAENLSLPTNMAIDDNGVLYVANVTSSKVIKLDRDGHFLGSFGKRGTGLGQFGRPRGISVDSAGRLFAIDVEHQNAQIFDTNGRLLMFFGEPASKLPTGTMNIPADIFVHREALDFYQQFASPGFTLEEVILVTNQVGNEKVAIYGLGRMEGVDYEKYVEETESLRKKKAEKNKK
ncbi:hypothetical protein [uncultured Desulfuromonas sp.]|uniref:hypothetical protein n=1 Tax=uncultured Desulfuromonas sp. TaxID=181013 RepID=UPI00262D937E|nr:hypothetical protein [uncultured Desulfuromonas sp.]